MDIIRGILVVRTIEIRVGNSESWNSRQILHMTDKLVEMPPESRHAHYWSVDSKYCRRSDHKVQSGRRRKPEDREIAMYVQS